MTNLGLIAVCIIAIILAWFMLGYGAYTIAYFQMRGWLSALDKFFNLNNNTKTDEHGTNIKE